VLAAVAAALLASERANADALDRTVGAGALSATIEPDPFRIKIGALDGLAGVVRLADRPRRITIVGWPSGASSTEIAPGATLSVKESGRRLIVSLRAPKRYRVNLWLSTDLLRRPCARSHVRHLFVHASKARLVVPACPAKR
jgi:hypothetical protein